MKKMSILLILLLPLVTVAAQQPNAVEVMNKSRELSIASSLSATLKLTITEKNGSERNRTVSMTTKSYSGGLEKRLVRFLEPADVRGTAMLIVDHKDATDEMWIDPPALKKTRRIVSSEKGKSFMSSEFSNSDMTSPTIAISNIALLAISPPVTSGRSKVFRLTTIRPMNTAFRRKSVIYQRISTR